MDITLGVPFAAANVIIPVEGPKVAMATLDFTGTDGTYSVDASQIIQQGKISYIQTLWVDNADNPTALTIVMAITGQRVIVPANTQQYVNVLAPNMPVFNCSTTAGAFKVVIGFINVPIQPDQWLGASIGGSSTVSVIGPTIVDYSLTLDGTSQTVLTADQGASYFAIQNPTGNADITVNLSGGDALTSGIVIPGGGSLTLESGLANSVTVSGTNTQNVIAFAG
jgi:hypothetical protein